MHLPRLLLTVDIVISMVGFRDLIPSRMPVPYRPGNLTRQCFPLNEKQLQDYHRRFQ